MNRLQKIIELADGADSWPHGHVAYTQAANPQTVKAMAELLVKAEEVLRMMRDEKADYMAINNLGKPEDQHTIKHADQALAAIQAFKENR